MKSILMSPLPSQFVSSSESSQSLSPSHRQSKEIHFPSAHEYSLRKHSVGIPMNSY